MNKKGFTFSLDMALAITLFVTVISLLYLQGHNESYPQVTYHQKVLADDIIQLITSDPLFPAINADLITNTMDETYHLYIKITEYDQTLAIQGYRYYNNKSDKKTVLASTSVHAQMNQDTQQLQYYTIEYEVSKQ